MKTIKHVQSNSKIAIFKPILSLLICVFMTTLAFSQNTSNADVGVFDFEAEIIDYGTINKNDDGLRIFKFTNRGTAPIVISNVKTSCGCTVPTFSKAPVLPGETGIIEIKYATNRIGKFSKSITVMSNADEAQKRLKIKGEVLKSPTN